MAARRCGAAVVVAVLLRLPQLLLGADPAVLSVDRAEVERVKAGIRGTVHIVDWHGTWDFTTIQAALDAAGDGDTVIVLPSAGSPAGAYVENIVFPPRAITLQSIEPQDPGIVAATVIDGNTNGTVVRFETGTPQAAALLGITITNGVANGICGEQCGGGLQLIGSSPLIGWNRITGNTAACGGGIYCEGDSPPTIIHNTIKNNTAENGGGLYLSFFHSTVANNVITENKAQYGGAAVYLYKSSATVANNTITGNIGGLATIIEPEGSILRLYFSSPVIVDNVFLANIAPGYSGMLYMSKASTPLIANNTIAGNICAAALASDVSSPTVTNNLVAFNSAGIRMYASPSASLRHNCVYQNAAYDYHGVDDPTGTDGNISVDPRLANFAYGDVHIQADSPCRDAGDDAVVQAGRQDIDGAARIAGGHVDIGADESDGTIWPAGPNMIVRVRPDGDDGNDGSSWAKAKATVQAGIDAAAGQGGDVWVQAGTYVERVSLARWVHVYGGFAGAETMRDERDWAANTTTLDGNHSGAAVSEANVGHGLSTIDGFTIRNCAPASPGIACQASSPTIANNFIYYNKGGISLTAHASPKITQNFIIDNNTPSNGGAIYCGTYASPTIMHNAITDNRAGAGGGIALDLYGSPSILQNTIVANSASGSGGGIYGLVDLGSPTISRNMIVSNSAGITGGGVYCDNATIADNAIMGNSAGSRGGGVFCTAGSARIVNNTVATNDATNGGGIYCSYSSATISNTIVAFNTSGMMVFGSDQPTLRHNCLYGNAAYDFLGSNNPIGADGNVSVDPAFVQDPAAGPDGTWGTTDDNSGDVHLRAGSPCVDAGSNGDVGDDLDVAGHLRVIDGDWDGAAVVDMGAYEYLPADMDGDGAVDLRDYALWADCLAGPGSAYAPGCLPADLDADGDIDLVDFARFGRVMP